MDLSFIKREFFPNTSERRINSGDCFNWAYIAYLLYPKKVTLYSDDDFTHAFIGIGNLYFDSECPTGVDDWEKLPTYNRCSYGEVFEHDLEDFLHDWGMHGKHWDMLDDIPDLVDHYLNKSAEVPYYYDQAVGA